MVTKKIVGETFALVKEMMEKSGIFDVASLVKDQLNKSMNDTSNGGKQQTGNSQFSQTDDTGSQLSEMTVYENAVRDNTKQKENNRGSTSSEDGLDTSDETNFEGGETANQLNQLLISDIFQDEVRVRARAEDLIPLTLTGVTETARQPKAMTKVLENHDKSQLRLTPEEKAERLIREAEAAKTHMYATPGKVFDSEKIEVYKQFHSAMVEEDYLLVAAHVDSVTLGKIVTGDYVDFAKLIPRDKVLQEDDQRLEVVVRGGKTFWVPAADREVQSIHNFSKWEQAFRIYSDIYLRSHPARSTELIQYNHIIHTAALTYIWDNVYTYDKEFRLHLSRHPERCWGIIL